MSTPQVVIVTGSSSGFGFLIVQTLARHGHMVFAGMRSSTGKNAAVAAALHAWATAEQMALEVIDLDVTEDESVAHAVAQVQAVAGRIDVVVNNAGVAYVGPVEAFTVEQVQQQFDTNVFGVLRMNRTVLPQMRTQGRGLLVQIGSVAGRLAFPFTGIYGATKFALEGLTESYRAELAPVGIDAVIVEPGTYPTNIGANNVGPADGARMAPYADAMGTFIQRFFADLATTPPDPQEVADAVATLIATPIAERPLRTVVGLPTQRHLTEQVNDATERATRAYLDAIGVTKLMTAGAASRG